MARRVLVLLTIASGLALIYNTLDPPASYAYRWEMVALVIVGVVSALLPDDWSILFYGVFAPLPVLTMLRHGDGPGSSPLQYVPLIGIGALAVLTKRARWTFFYSGWALILYGVVFYDSPGRAGSLWAITSTIGTLAVYYCLDEMEKEKHRNAIRKAQREIKGAIADQGRALEAIRHGTK